MPPKKRHASVPQDWLAPEAMVEVTMEEPGLVGSRYPARVLQVRAGKALVEFPAFEEDEKSEAKLKEWVAYSLVAPPPPPTGADFVRRIKAGQPLDLWHEDGWWRVTVTGTGPDGISIAAEDYGAVRTVDASCLRPRWQFVGTEWQVDDTLRPLLREMLSPAAPAAPAAPVSSSPAKAGASYAVLPTPSEDLPPGWSVELRETGTGRKYKVYSKPGEPQCNSLKVAWSTWQAAGGGPPQAQQEPAATAPSPAAEVGEVKGGVKQMEGALPDGWVCNVHEKSTTLKQKYKRYKGPNGECAQSVTQAWLHHDATAAGGSVLRAGFPKRDREQAGAEAGPSAQWRCTGRPPHAPLLSDDRVRKLAEAKELKDKELIDEDEYKQMKAVILGKAIAS